MIQLDLVYGRLALRAVFVVHFDNNHLWDECCKKLGILAREKRI